MLLNNYNRSFHVEIRVFKLNEENSSTARGKQLLNISEVA